MWNISRTFLDKVFLGTNPVSLKEEPEDEDVDSDDDSDAS